MEQRYTFNRDKYKAILAKKGLTQQMVAVALGRSHSYGSHLIIDQSFVDGLRKYYGISPEDIGAVPVCKEKPKSDDAVPVCDEKPKSDDHGIDYDQLYKCIYGAVYQAVKKAWNE